MNKMNNTIKRCIISAVSVLLLAVISGSISFAQVPKLLNYQGYLEDKATGLPVEGTKQITFTIYSDATSTDQIHNLWSETQTVEIVKGRFSVLLGKSVPINLTEAKPYWLGITIGSDPEMTPREELTSVLYALFVDGITVKNGNVGIGTTNPAPDRKLHVAGHGQFDVGAGSIALTTPGGTTGIIALSPNGHRRDILFANDLLGLWVSNSSAGPQHGKNGITIRENGNVGIGTNSPASDRKLHVVGHGQFDVGAGSIALTTPGGSPGMIALSPQGHRRDIIFRDDAMCLWASNSSAAPQYGESGITIKENGNVGIGIESPQQKLDVNGTTRTKVLQITGGSDIAEPFEITGSAIEPGMVVAIDPQRPGQLRVADTGYDRTVAGIISGAGGVQPGLTLQQENSIADGAYPVAMSGRVYCWTDASYGQIEPGDLLTTSDTPGHAMKVSDYAKAQGAILGKAMSSLESGQGLVLVLVTLQ